MIYSLLVTTSRELFFKDIDFTNHTDMKFTFLSLMGFKYLDINHSIKKLKPNNNYWIIFTSKNAVRAVFRENKFDYPIAVIGSETAKEVLKYGKDISFKPSIAKKEAFAREFYDYLISNNFKGDIIYFRGNTASEYISNYFDTEGISIQQVICYDVIKNEINDSEIFELIEFLNGKTENSAIMILSSLQARYLCELVDYLMIKYNNNNLNTLLRNFKVITIGENTKVELQKLGFLRVFNSETQSIHSMLKAAYKLIGGKPSK